MAQLKIRSTLLIACLFMASLVNADPVWIDVRSAGEYQNDHIEGDLRISHTDIVDKLGEIYPDKATEIRLYCARGGRAGKAVKWLQEAGYENVTNAGGISDARKKRGLE